MLIIPIAIIFIVIITVMILMYNSTIKYREKRTPSVAIAALMRKPVDLPLWLKHHREFGVKWFFLRLEDSPSWVEYLRTQPDVLLEIGESDLDGDNYQTLQSRQVEFVNKCIDVCKKKKVDWIFHIDADELLNGSLDFLSSLSEHVKCLHYENAEALFEGEEKHCFSSNTFLRCGLGAPCRAYVNGKGAGRIVDGVTIAGPHDFAYKGNIEGTHLLNVPFDTLHVLHFDSCTLGAWIEKFQHLSKNPKSDVPFQYYKHSIQSAVSGYETYKTYTHVNITEDIDPQFVYNT